MALFESLLLAALLALGAGFVDAYGGQFVRIQTWAEFDDAVSAALRRGGLQVIEVPTQRARNVQQHRGVWRAVSEALIPVAAG